MNRTEKDIKSLRYGMFITLSMLIASIVMGCLSYSSARQNITNDLNDAMIALADENREVLTRKDTIAALKVMYETTRKPMIYRASGINLKNAALKDSVYFTLAIVDKNNTICDFPRSEFVSDSIMLMPEKDIDGIAIQIQGYADCSMASIFSASDQTIPGILFCLSVLSIMSMFLWRRKSIHTDYSEPSLQNHPISSIDNIRLTPMQRQFTQMLLDSPGHRVNKATICEVLWNNKDNADESLYTLVRRTKKALADTELEIICNRGESYELRINS